MFSRTHSSIVKDVRADQVWSVWSDVNQWHQWQDDIEFARLDAPFEAGSRFKFKPGAGQQSTSSSLASSPTQPSPTLPASHWRVCSTRTS